jgi:hypothetical protein
MSGALDALSPDQRRGGGGQNASAPGHPRAADPNAGGLFSHAGFGSAAPLPVSGAAASLMSFDRGAAGGAAVGNASRKRRAGDALFGGGGGGGFAWQAPRGVDTNSMRDVGEEEDDDGDDSGADGGDDSMNARGAAQGGLGGGGQASADWGRTSAAAATGGAGAQAGDADGAEDMLGAMSMSKRVRYVLVQGCGVSHAGYG